jgi:hypothetical protein
MGIFNFMSGKKLDKVELNGMLNNEARGTAGILASASTLDALDARVMVLDPTHTMVLVNTAARQMLMHAEIEMRKQIPGFSADRLTGSKVDIFFRNPTQQRELFESMLSTQRDRLQFGTRMFDIVMTPVFGEDQVRLGTVIEWRDAVDKPKKERVDAEKIALEVAALRPVIPAGPSEAEVELRKEVAGHNTALESIQKAVDAALAGNLVAYRGSHPCRSRRRHVREHQQIAGQL